MKTLYKQTKELAEIDRKNQLKVCLKSASELLALIKQINIDGNEIANVPMIAGARDKALWVTHDLDRIWGKVR